MQVQPHNYALDILLVNDDKPLCYGLMYLPYHTFIIILEYTVSNDKKMFALKQYAMVCQ